MKTRITLIGALLAGLTVFAISAYAGIVSYDKSVDYSQYIRRDRNLNVEIWTNNDEYYEGDKINISFRTNRDCFVAIYNIDTRGRVNLIYPSDQGDAGQVRGGRIYQIPESGDNYELTVDGPAGTEYLQMVASSEPFPLPDWSRGSGLVSDDDPNYYLNYVNATYFGCDDDCVRALDMTSFQVKEWQDYYFRPVYHHDYPDWSMCGSVYIDYPFGSSVYIDGIYWGCAPLFIPRVYFGYHYITIYDWDGYCWEDRIDVARYRSVILDNSIIRTHPGVRSRYREVAQRGFRDPAKNGYPDYQKEVRVKETYKADARRGFDNSSDKTRMIYREKPTYDNRDVRGEKGTYNTRQTTRENSNSADKRRAGEWKVQKMTGTTRESGRYETPKTERSRGTAVEKKSSGDRTVERRSGGTVERKSSGDRSSERGSSGSAKPAPSSGGSRGGHSDGSKERR